MIRALIAVAITLTIALSGGAAASAVTVTPRVVPPAPVRVTPVTPPRAAVRSTPAPGYTYQPGVGYVLVGHSSDEDATLGEVLAVLAASVAALAVVAGLLFLIVRFAR